MSVEALNKLEETASLPALQDYIRRMVAERGFEGETPKELLILLTEELGELAREIRKISDMKYDVKKERSGNMEGELADIFIYLLSMCNVLGVDLFTAFKDKERINCSREWR